VLYTLCRSMRVWNFGRVHGTRVQQSVALLGRWHHMLSSLITGCFLLLLCLLFPFNEVDNNSIGLIIIKLRTRFLALQLRCHEFFHMLGRHRLIIAEFHRIGTVPLCQRTQGTGVPHQFRKWNLLITHSHAYCTTKQAWKSWAQHSSDVKIPVLQCQCEKSPLPCAWRPRHRVGPPRQVSPDACRRGRSKPLPGTTRRPEWSHP
jgi:hypothetical protein